MTRGNISGMPSAPSGFWVSSAKERTFPNTGTDVMLRSAVERQLEIIGEALNKLAKTDQEIASQTPELARIVALRNILIHGYAEIDNRLVWQVVVDKLPELDRAIGNLLT